MELFSSPRNVSTPLLNTSVPRFYEKRDAEDAMDGLDGHRIDGRDIRYGKCKI